MLSCSQAVEGQDSTCKNKEFVPEWTKILDWYQIFPERSGLAIREQKNFKSQFYLHRAMYL